MSTSLLIEIVLLIACLLLVSLFYYRKGWKASFPFKNTDIFKLLYTLVFPMLWGSSSVICGFIYLFLSKNFNSLDFLFLFGFPTILMTFTFWKFRKNNKHIEEIKREEDTKVRDKSKKTEDWVHQFSFVEEQDFNIKTYISKGRPISRLFIYNVNNEQQKELKNNEDLLPDGVYLEIFMKKLDSDNNSQV
ncbi:hypothetical protein [Saccharibacillus brassicae]|uniref:Uncharacterized protein n=1 Tax=Saccharibacillus brassicae TaxID=2583377 RepID=A0A4Y6UYZ5_SACBS|nr:hypothetical protein [Saccharibacillus brassicae]QDH21225.1 hypothetical protein FFV09_10400 [Saccharibacillus brassicae]